MANINHFQMSENLKKDTRISIKKGFLGFGSKMIYNTTQSEIKAYKQEYDASVGEQIRQTLSLSADDVKTAEKFPQKDLGNYQLELFVSDDRQFLAISLYRYEDLCYKPIMDIKVFENREAEVFAALFL
jgi:hypothetical protein